MKAVCCDTSFLYAAYAADTHTVRAIRQINSLRRPLTLSILHLFELENALRSSSFRGFLPREKMILALDAFEADYRERRIDVLAVDLSKIVAEGRRLSASYTLQQGHRAFDILLVAAALCLGAGEFWSFDANQRKLAAAEGLKVNPSS